MRRYPGSSFCSTGSINSSPRFRTLPTALFTECKGCPRPIDKNSARSPPPANVVWESTYSSACLGARTTDRRPSMRLGRHRWSQDDDHQSRSPASSTGRWATAASIPTPFIESRGADALECCKALRSLPQRPVPAFWLPRDVSQGSYAWISSDAWGRIGIFRSSPTLRKIYWMCRDHFR